MFGQIKIIKAKRMFNVNPETGNMEIINLPLKDNVIESKVDTNTIQYETKRVYYKTIKSLREDLGLKIPRDHIRGDRGRYFYNPN